MSEPKQGLGNILAWTATLRTEDLRSCDPEMLKPWVFPFSLNTLTLKCFNPKIPSPKNSWSLKGLNAKMRLS